MIVVPLAGVMPITTRTRGTCIALYIVSQVVTDSPEYRRNSMHSLRREM